MRVGDINERLDLTLDEQGWLSLRPSGAKYRGGDYFGEFDENNKLHGRSIGIFPNNNIFIQYLDKARDEPGRVYVGIMLAYLHSIIEFTTGSLIYILSDGVFIVGEYNKKDGKIC